MIRVRLAEERGHANHGWLDTHHTFSFADYYDPRFMGFRSLRVINEDRVAAGAGFPTHGHRDMEILSYVIEGGLEHKDSMGTGSVIRPGQLQRMSAGRGVLHSEYNASAEEPVHFLQIWILPEQAGLEPSYEEKSFEERERLGSARLIASRDGREGSVVVHQDVGVYSSVLDEGMKLVHDLEEGRHAWIQVTRGELLLNQGHRLKAGDGAAISEELRLEIASAGGRAELLLFDLA